MTRLAEPIPVCADTEESLPRIPRKPLRIVATSDIHGYEPKLPEGDVLVLAGDLTSHGTAANVDKLSRWLIRIATDFKAVIVVAGNHDWWFQERGSSHGSRYGYWREHNIYYLEDDGVTIEGVRFWGSPWTPQFYNWAFMDDDDNLRDHFKLIPNDTDVLVTHGPMLGILDLTERGPNAGSFQLAMAIGRVQPKVHIFGHIHEAYGFHKDPDFPTRFYNVAHCNLQYAPVQPPVTIDILAGRYIADS